VVKENKWSDARQLLAWQESPHAETAQITLDRFEQTIDGRALAQ
jgi:hypothetical protein